MTESHENTEIIDLDGEPIPYQIRFIECPVIYVQPASILTLTLFLVSIQFPSEYRYKLTITLIVIANLRRRV